MGLLPLLLIHCGMLVRPACIVNEFLVKLSKLTLDALFFYDITCLWLWPVSIFAFKFISLKKSSISSHNGMKLMAYPLCLTLLYTYDCYLLYMTIFDWAASYLWSLTRIFSHIKLYDVQCFVQFFVRFTLFCYCFSFFLFFYLGKWNQSLSGFFILFTTTPTPHF